MTGAKSRAVTALVLGGALTLAGGGAAAGAAPAPRHLSFFASPSRNISCLIIDATARCDITARSWSPPRRPASCPKIVDFGQGLIVGATGAAGLVCAGDTVMNPSARTLAYGQADVIGTLRCTSALSGVTCASTRTGHGFFISRQGYRLF
jgi:hypothetical protein